MILAMRPRKKDFDRYFRALSRVEDVARLRCISLPRTCAEEHREDLTKAILTQRYAGQWKPYSDRYAKWKTEMLGSTGKFWLLFGDLINSIIAVNRGGGGSAWFTGIPKSAMDSGGKSWFGSPGNQKGKSKSIAMYAKANEGIRPLFGPARTDYANTRWPVIARRSLRSIATAWRR
jgi:hypothetical protein